jgi:hypothetical protein
MKSAYNYLQNKDIFYDNSENINLALNEYRKWFLRKSCINYSKLNKGTPIQIEKIISAFNRKINDLELFKNYDIKIDYIKGLKTIFNQYYELKSKEQKDSKQFKKIEQQALLYIINKKL